MGFFTAFYRMWRRMVEQVSKKSEEVSASAVEAEFIFLRHQHA